MSMGVVRVHVLLFCNLSSQRRLHYGPHAIRAASPLPLKYRTSPIFQKSYPSFTAPRIAALRPRLQLLFGIEYDLWTKHSRPTYVPLYLANRLCPRFISMDHSCPFLIAGLRLSRQCRPKPVDRLEQAAQTLHPQLRLCHFGHHQGKVAIYNHYFATRHDSVAYHKLDRI